MYEPDKELLEGELRAIRNISANLPNNKAILDIGFGNGKFSFTIFNAVLPKVVIGIEAKSVERSPDVEVGYVAFQWPIGFPFMDGGSAAKPVADFLGIFRPQYSSSLSSFLEENTMKFDLVIMANVLHYRAIGDQIEVLNAIRILLNAGGLVFVRQNQNSNQTLTRQVTNVSLIASHLRSSFKSIECEVLEGMDRVCDDDTTYLEDNELSNDDRTLYFVGMVKSQSID